MEHFDILRPNCTAQPKYVLKPTCSHNGKWCGSDDDAHTNTGRGSTPTTCFDHATLVDSRLAMQLFFFETVLGTTFCAIYLLTLPSLQGLGRSQILKSTRPSWQPWTLSSAKGSGLLTQAVLSARARLHATFDECRRDQVIRRVLPEPLSARPRDRRF